MIVIRCHNRPMTVQCYKIIACDFQHVLANLNCRTFLYFVVYFSCILILQFCEDLQRKKQ